VFDSGALVSGLIEDCLPQVRDGFDRLATRGAAQRANRQPVANGAHTAGRVEVVGQHQQVDAPLGERVERARRPSTV
jgi:hypothetical protein